MEKLYRDRDWLWKHYIVQEKSLPVIAKEARCGKETIRQWLYKLGIPIRSPSEGIFLAKRNSVIIVPDFLEFLRGEIIGDGYVGMQLSGRSALYAHSSKYKEYLIWLSGRFDKWGIEQTGKITRHKDKQNGAIGYRYASKSYPELVDVYRHWYPNGKKIVPKDLKLTPIMARQWYLGDGHLAHPTHSRPYIHFSTYDFDIASVNYLVKELCKQGFKAVRWPSSNCISLSVYSVQDFLAWIGPCPISCYDYKWNYSKGDK